MPDNIIKFPGARRASRQTSRGSGVNISTLCFRSYNLILKSNDATLMRDVRRDVNKAAVKVEAIRKRLRSVKERSAAQIEMLTNAEIKLNTALVAAIMERA